eukprot:SAG11_NODE_17686_length_511_cov_1.254854_1_plen_77_part_01
MWGGKKFKQRFSALIFVQHIFRANKALGTGLKPSDVDGDLIKDGAPAGRAEHSVVSLVCLPIGHQRERLFPPRHRRS